jgi:hypothetical protein
MTAAVWSLRCRGTENGAHVTRGEVGEEGVEGDLELGACGSAVSGRPTPAGSNGMSSGDVLRGMGDSASGMAAS